MAEKEVRLIDANEVHRLLDQNLDINKGKGCSLSETLVREIVDSTPTIDPESLRAHGKWLLEAHKESTNYRWNVTVECSNCCDEQKEIWAGFFPNVPDWLARDVALDSAASVKLSNYCPNCGAKMDKED